MSPKSIIYFTVFEHPPTPCRSMFEISHAVTCVFSAFYFITGKYSIESMSTTVAYSLANNFKISMKIIAIHIIAIHDYVGMYICMSVCVQTSFYFLSIYLGEVCVMCQTVSEDGIIFTCSSTVYKTSVALHSFSNLHIIFALKNGSIK